MAAENVPNHSVQPRIGSDGTVYYEVFWRIDGRQRKRRLGKAWLDAQGDGFVKRKGRVAAGWLDEKAAHVEARAVVLGDAAEAQRRATDAESSALPTVRELVHEWLDFLVRVKGNKPSTMEDYRYLFAEPGTPHRRGGGTNPGHVLAALGAIRIDRVTSKEVTRLLDTLDPGRTPRTVNKYRQTLVALFEYACQADTYELPKNPAAATKKRREDPTAALDYYEPHEIRALSEAAKAGKHRKRRTADTSPEELEAQAVDDQQDGAFFLLLGHSALRLGELRALTWADVDLADGVLFVRYAFSAGVRTTPKSRQSRYVQLTDAAVEELTSLTARGRYLSPDDFVFCNRLGRPLDASATRRRYKAAAKAAGLRPVKLHGLRHAGGSIAARTSSIVEVRDFLGHSRLETTNRYMASKFTDERRGRLNAAFSEESPQRAAAEIPSVATGTSRQMGSRSTQNR